MENNLILRKYNNQSVFFKKHDFMKWIDNK